jgi:hypothetical protein
LAAGFCNLRPAAKKVEKDLREAMAQTVAKAIVAEMVRVTITKSAFLFYVA